jgi:DNA-binding NtrC family response regulator
VPPLVWLWESDRDWRDLLTALLEEAFAVRYCSDLSAVWKEVLVGQTGVLAADFTRWTSVGLPDQARLSSLASITPVLLLVEEPALAHLAITEGGACNVLFRPFEDLDRLLAAVDELSQLTPHVGTHALSAF